MADSQDQIARLQAEVNTLENEVADLEVEVLDIQRELDEFTAQYDRIVKPKVDRLELIQQMIKDLESEQNQPHSSYTETWQPPGYVSVEEQFNRVWRSPHNEQNAPKKTLYSDWEPPQNYVPVEEQFQRAWGRPLKGKSSSTSSSSGPAISAGSDASAPVDPKTLKQLYRRLARRFHPDLTIDPLERKRRNRLMIEINDAYSRRDYVALRTLDQQPADADLDRPLASIQLLQLRQIRDQLERRLSALREERTVLLNSEMMGLKLQASMLARSGRNLLKEMADQLEHDYVIQLDKLDDLRRGAP